MGLLADKILSFYQSLEAPALPKEVITLDPYRQPDGWKTTEEFYQKYYADEKPRKVLFGINPGRLGGGITGIPFTDPVALESYCGIPNDFTKRRELSSTFIYDMINAFGGPADFYSRYFISAISPLGYVQDDKNLNYYDIKNWKSLFEKPTREWMKTQVEFGLDTSIAYSIGKGKNLKFLEELNDELGLFDRIEHLPHPRWVMQYRTKRKDEFIEEYIDKLRP